MVDSGNNLAASLPHIGCCGAFCGSCPCLADHSCNGCKLGYDEGKRDIRAARCAIKRCCFMDRKLGTCADCNDFPTCVTIQGFFAKNGYKYRKYRESLEFIRLHGYLPFITAARSWKRAYGGLKPQDK